MEIIQTQIEGLLIIKPKILGDHRGFFYESYRRDLLKVAGVDYNFVQDNRSMSAKNIVRGLHFQKPPHAQGKLVEVIRGAVLDVALDIRISSKTYGQHLAIELSEENKTLLWIPPGFAHGFLTLADNTLFSYKCTDYYNKESEAAIRWDSPGLDIDWRVSDPVLSEKDIVAPLFTDFRSPFG